MPRAPFARYTNVLDTPVAFTGHGVWRGHSFANPTAGPLLVTVADDDGAGTGLVIAAFNLAAHTYEFQMAGTSGVEIERGLHVVCGAGITVAVVFHSTESLLMPGVELYDDENINL